MKPLADREVPPFGDPLCFIDGRQRTGEGEPFEVTFPVTGETLCEVRSASLGQVEEAVAAARRTFDGGGWRLRPAQERAAVLERTAQILEGRREALVETILFDNGKTRPEAAVDVASAVASCRRAAAFCCAQEVRRELPERGVEKRVVREPVGVVAGMTPYNAPLMFAGLKAMDPLASGNSVILKVSERSPLVAVELCRAAAEAGLPAGVLNLVHGGVEVAAALSSHDGVDMITITGGSAAGSAVMRAAAPTIKNLLLELGGKSAHIVLADADLDKAIPAVAAGIFRNAGQRCFSGSRLVVDAAVAEQVEEGVTALASSLRVGDPFEEGTQIGPMIDPRAVAAVEAFVQRATADGLEVAAGGRRPAGMGGGSFFLPTVLTGARADSHEAREEIFGPVLTSIRVAGVEEAIAVANASRYGLAGGVWTGDEATALQVAHGVRCGYFWINTYGAIFGDVPFGGFGLSGLGREAGIDGYNAYTEQKTILIDREGGGSAPLF